MSLKQTFLIDVLSNSIPDAVCNVDSIPGALSATISDCITHSYPEVTPKAIPEAILESNSIHAHSTTLHQDGGFWQRVCEAVGKYLSSQCLAQVDLSISSHICSKIVFGRNVCDWISAVDSVHDARDQWLWFGEHVRESQNAELIQDWRDLGESHEAYSRGIVFGIGSGLCSWHLLSRPVVRRSSTGDHQSTCQCIVILASGIVRIDITSSCAFSFSSNCNFSKCSSKSTAESTS